MKQATEPLTFLKKRFSEEKGGCNVFGNGFLIFYFRAGYLRKIAIVLGTPVRKWLKKLLSMRFGSNYSD